MNYRDIANSLILLRLKQTVTHCSSFTLHFLATLAASFSQTNSYTNLSRPVCEMHSVHSLPNLTKHLHDCACIHNT